jgi:hypothetical protein
MGHNYQWARFRQLRNSLASLPAFAFDDVTLAGPNSPPTAVRRILSFPSVSSRWDPAAANPPAFGWWMSAQVTCMAVWSPDGSALTGRDEFGEADPPAVSLGFVRLYPHLTPAGEGSTQWACTWLPDAREVEFESQRRTDVPPSPVVTVSLWAQDFYGVFQNAGHLINVAHSSVNYGSVLFDNPF